MRNNIGRRRKGKGGMNPVKRRNKYGHGPIRGLSFF